MASAALDEGTAKAAVAASAARGFLDGRALAEVFAWLRPGDLIWPYWVNNYLQGLDPPPGHPLLECRHDQDAGRLHRDFVRLAVDNALTRPDAAAMLGSPVDLAKLDIDAYVVAGVADHLCPWQSCYRSTQLLGGRPGSCCPPAATSPPWSTRRATSGPTTPDRGGHPAGPRRLAWPGDDRARLLVARLRRLAGAARRQREDPTPAAGRRRLPPAGPRPRHLRPGPLRRAMERSMRAIAVGDQQLRVAVPGDGTRTPLVLANGIGASLELLQPFVDHLDPGIEVVRLMPWGRRLTAAADPYRLPRLARLLARLLDQLGYATVDLLGISWGGGLAQQFARSATAAGGWSWSPPALAC